MASAVGGDEVRGIGARLRAAREKQGLTVLAAAERLHVDARILEALEAGDFAVLGADVYVRGHLRRYAEAVGESPAELQELYAGGGARAPQPDLTRIPRAPPRGDSSHLMLPALLLVVGAAAAGVLWWALHLQSGTAQPISEPAVAPASRASGGAGAAPAPASGAAAPGAAPGLLPTAAAGQAQLGLKFSAMSWVEVSDAGGRRLLHGLVGAGAERALSGTAPLRVILGNAPAVALEVNGRPVALGALIHRNGSAHLLIDQAGRASAAPPRLAHGD
jgi:cytoskeleton protein RodZ